MNLFYTDKDLVRNEDKRKAIKDTLSDLKESTPWEIFLPIMQKAFRKKAPKAPGGRPAFSLTVMMKILILQRVYNLSDQQMEYQILDRNSFKEFLGLKADSIVPDEKTIWYYRNQLAQTNCDQQLFNAFLTYLEEQGKIVKEGVLVDASFIEVPKSHFTKEEKEKMEATEKSLKETKSVDKPEEKAPEVQKTSKEMHRERQMDKEARWTKKHGKSYFGYKDHVKVDAKSKLITGYKVTPASVHDSPVLPELMDLKKDEGQEVYGDKGYTSDNNNVFLKANKMKSRIMKKRVKNKPLTQEEEEKNRLLSKVRSRVEHVFGFMENSMNGMRLRAKGLTRITFMTGMMNLTYNIMRYEFLCRGRSAL
jgi:transposase, IS5 family